jgi:hypothetical protein
MAVSFTSIVADLTNVVTEAQKAVPALEALLTVVEKVKPLVPAADQTLVTEGESALTALISVLAKV